MSHFNVLAPVAPSSRDSPRLLVFARLRSLPSRRSVARSSQIQSPVLKSAQSHQNPSPNHPNSPNPSPRKTLAQPHLPIPLAAAAMAGSSGGTASSSRTVPENRFYSPPHVRRQQLQQRLQGQRSASPSLSPSPSPRSARQKPPPPPPGAIAVAVDASLDVDSRVDSDDSSSTTSSKPSVASAAATTTTAVEVNVTTVGAAAAEEAGNLERFLTSTTPSVPALYLPKVFWGLISLLLQLAAVWYPLCLISKGSDEIV